MVTEDHGNGDTRVPMGDFRGLQQLVQGLHDEQERLLGTAANLSHEMEVNQEHIKVLAPPTAPPTHNHTHYLLQTLYKAAGDLKAMKVDKDQLAMEVDEVNNYNYCVVLDTVYTVYIHVIIIIIIIIVH